MTGTKSFEESVVKMLTILLLQEVDALKSLNAVNLQGIFSMLSKIRSSMSCGDWKCTINIIDGQK